jgi:hypothetical protein
MVLQIIYEHDGAVREDADIVNTFAGRDGVVVSAAGDYTAAQITNVPSGGVLSNNVQDAINELGVGIGGFDTRTAAVAATINEGILHLRTAGYYEVGDGGGAEYKRVDVEPGHPGKFQSADGDWWEYVGNEIDIRVLGAYCDGAHEDEDTGAFYNASLMLQTGAVGTIRLPPNSTTLINAQITFGSGTGEIRGYGSTSVLKIADDADINILMHITSTGGLDLRDFVIHGNRGNGAQSPSETYAVVIQDGGNVNIIGVEFKEVERIAVAVFLGSKILIDGCSFHDIGVTEDTGVNNIAIGIYGSATDITVVNSRFEDIYPIVGPIGDSVAINIVNGETAVIASNIVRNCLNAGGGVIACDANSGQVDSFFTVIGNHVEQTITFQADVDPLSSNDDDTSGIEIDGSDAICVGNRISGCTAAGIVVADAEHGLVVTGNVIDTVGIGVYITSTTANNIIATGNHIASASFGIVTDAAHTGDNIVFSNNTLLNVTTTSSGAGVTKYGNVGGTSEVESFNGKAPGAAGAQHTLVARKTGIADATATGVITVTVPNAAHNAAIFLDILAHLGTGTDASESSRCATGCVVLARKAGADTVATVATLETPQIATVAGGGTLTLAYDVSTLTGASGATQTFTIRLTLTVTGTITDHTAVVSARLLNSLATGVTMAAA